MEEVSRSSSCSAGVSALPKSSCGSSTSWSTVGQQVDVSKSLTRAAVVPSGELCCVCSAYGDSERDEPPSWVVATRAGRLPPTGTALGAPLLDSLSSSAPGKGFGRERALPAINSSLNWSILRSWPTLG